MHDVSLLLLIFTFVITSMTAHVRRVNRHRCETSGQVESLTVSHSEFQFGFDFDECRGAVVATAGTRSPGDFDGCRLKGSDVGTRDTRPP